MLRLLDCSLHLLLAMFRYSIGLTAFSLVLACVESEAPELDSQSQAIVGGQGADIAMAPYQVSLQVQNRLGAHVCGGAIVDENWIITAAHCGDPTHIVAGGTRLSAGGQRRQVAEVIRYPSYDIDLIASQGGDLELLRLETPLELDGVNTKPIQINLSPNNEFETPGRQAVFTGWGRLATEGTTPDQLQYIEFPLGNIANPPSDFAAISNNNQQIPAGNEGVGVCFGDSGGPLVTIDAATGDPILVGIASWVPGACGLTGYGSFSGMFARASGFESFLDLHTGALPIALAGDDLVAAVGTEVELDGSGSFDPGVGQIESFLWEQLEGTPLSIDAGNATVSIRLPDSPEELRFQLTVTDNAGNTASEEISVSVRAEDDPDIPEPDFPDPSDPSDPSTPEGGNVLGGCQGAGQGGGLLFGALLVLGLWCERKRLKV